MTSFLTTRFWMAWVVLALFWAGCGAKNEHSDKNTNWLRSCERSEGCGAGFQCVCGVCTSVCDRDAQCAELDEDAICIAVDEMSDACSGEVSVGSVCTLACSDDDHCTSRDERLACVDGECVTAPESAPEPGPEPGAGDAEPDDLDASSSPDAAQSDAGDAGNGFVVPNEVDPQVVAAIDAGCEEGFVCTARAPVTNRISAIVASDDGFVYFTDFGSYDERDNHNRDGTIVRVGKQEGIAEMAASGLDRPWRLWRDEGRLYWLSGVAAADGIAGSMQTLYRQASNAADPHEVLMTDAFAYLQVQSGELFWLRPYSYQEDGDSVEVRRVGLDPLADFWVQYFIEGTGYMLAGIDETHIYLQNGGGIVRGGLDGNMLAPFVTDTALGRLSVGADALWVIHFGSDTRVWASSMSKLDGSITHLGNAGDHHGALQPGETVLWFLAMEGSEWSLWSIPKAGGERTLAFRFARRMEVLREGVEGPVWIADGDDAWVYAHDRLVHVRRP